MSVSSLRAFEYLESQPGTTFRQLYQQPSTALAIFRRMLPHLAKTFVMALLYMTHPLPVTDLESWVRSDSKRERDQALSLLERLHVTSTASNPGQARAYSLTNPFRDSLRLALTGGGNHKSFGVPCKVPEDEMVLIEELDDIARKKWEGMLGYMVGSTGVDVSDQSTQLSAGVKTILAIGRLVEVRGRHVDITQEGFAFILQEVNAQVWTLLILYIENADDFGMNQIEILSFLFTLSSLTLGLPYSTSTLTTTQTQLLEDLSDFGIIHLPVPSYFYPTRLATTLTSDTSALSSISTSLSTATKGFIIIETNYRLYAYTSSTLQIAILQLFSRLSTRYPNMVSGKITRESIRRAVSMGITSEQIISFLSTHAHPQMRQQQQSSGNVPVLPPTVVDQIRLWQIEGERMKATTGYLFRDFINKEDWEGPCKYAEELGVLVWKSEGKRMFFVTRHEQVATYLKNKARERKGE